MILSYRYSANDKEDKKHMKEFLLDGDVDGNTPMHFAYTRSQPIVRDMLRLYEDKEIEIRMREKLNKFGECPHEMYHIGNYEITDDEGIIEERKQKRSLRLAQRKRKPFLCFNCKLFDTT
jgi:hypothetical protein